MVKTVLVVECQSNLNWTPIFEGATIASTGEEVKVEQGTWTEISLVSYDDQPGPVVTIRRGVTTNTFVADFVLLRSVSHGIRGQDSRPLLFGLAHSGVPAVNTVRSAILCLERPIVFGELKKVCRRLGKGSFPVIPQTYYPTHSDIVVAPDFPLVGKVGHAHAGAGKIKLTESSQLADFKSLCALHEDYVTLEPFIKWDFDSRIQKIGPHYRVFQRRSPNWKGNVGNSSVVSDAPVEEWHRTMADECSKLFGGLDILGLDLLHPEGAPEKQVVILELNDTAIGLVHAHEREDMEFMRDVVLARMEELWGEKAKRTAEEKAPDGAAPSAPSTTDAGHGGTVPAEDVLRLELERAKKAAAQAEQRVKELEEELSKERAKKKALFSFK